MNNLPGNEFTLDEAKEDISSLRKYDSALISAIRNAADRGVIEYLIVENKLDITHEGERGIGQVRQAVLESKVATDEQKRLVSLRGDETPQDILVPEDVYRNAKVALKAGKPVVLYGPTGTGKTTFAKQLARETCTGYSLNTATPSWTPSDIIGGIAPDHRGNSLSYRTKLGCVSEAVQRSRKFEVDYDFTHSLVHTGLKSSRFSSDSSPILAKKQ